MNDEERARLDELVQREIDSLSELSELFNLRVLEAKENAAIHERAGAALGAAFDRGQVAAYGAAWGRVSHLELTMIRLEG